MYYYLTFEYQIILLLVHRYYFNQLFVQRKINISNFGTVLIFQVHLFDCIWACDSPTFLPVRLSHFFASVAALIVCSFCSVTATAIVWGNFCDLRRVVSESCKYHKWGQNVNKSKIMKAKFFKTMLTFLSYWSSDLRSSIGIEALFEDVVVHVELVITRDIHSINTKIYEKNQQISSEKK